MANWPAVLPQDAFLGTTISDDESRLITPMDAGPSSVRNRFTAITKSVTVPIVLTGAELAVFNTFYRTTLSHGSSSFTWKDPSDGSTVTLRFKSAPKWTSISPGGGDSNKIIWQSSLDLEILP